MNDKKIQNTCSIIILNYNGKNLLEKNLPIVMKSAKLASADVVVADNGSGDGSVELLKMAFPEVELIEFKQNYGFAKGNNLAVTKVESDIVILLNNDVAPKDNTFVNLLNLFTENNIFSVTCKEETMSRGQKIIVGPPQADFHRGLLRHHPQMNFTTHTIECMYSSGGSAAFEREMFSKLGGFDSIYAPFYWEDADLSLRAWARGWKILFDPNSQVSHNHETTIKKVFPTWYVKAIGDRNMFIFNWRHINGLKFWIAHLIFLLPHIVQRPIGFILASIRIPQILCRRFIGGDKVSINKLLRLG